MALRAALSRPDIDLPVWRIHPRIGMSGRIFVFAQLRRPAGPSRANIAMLQRARRETDQLGRLAS
jgi:hypothetical protein